MKKLHMLFQYLGRAFGTAAGAIAALRARVR